MTITDLLTTYWSQLTLLLLGTGYFIKRLFDLKSRKKEINHSLFQQNRINSLNSFFSVYAKTELIWTDLAIYEILKHEISAKELDNLVGPTINDLKMNILQLQIYFEYKDYKHFTDIYDNILEIKGKLGELYFDFVEDTNITSKSNEYQFFYKEKLKDNNKILLQISLITRRIFNN